MTDTIMFVKETRTCEYVLVIHTPRLCGEPGFKSRHEQMPEAGIRCREVVDSVESVDPTLPEGRHPFKRKPRQPIPAPPSSPPPAKHAENDGEEKKRDMVDRAQDTAKLLRRAIESLLGREEADDVPIFELQPGEEEGGYYVDIDINDLQDAIEAASEQGQQPVTQGQGKTLEDALRAAGYNVKGQKSKVPPAEEDQGEETVKPRRAHEEL
jgi:protein OS-9